MGVRGLSKQTVRDIDVRGKRVLVRCDFNVPQDETGKITDDTRIRAALPTIQYLIQGEAKVILASHFGRPKGKVNEKYRLTAVAARLTQLLGQPIEKAQDCIGPSVVAAVAAMSPGQVLLLENVRFYAEEEKNDPSFARQLADLADVYVNDAFGTAHRAHASTAGVAAYLPAVAGFLMDKELSVMGGALTQPERPFVAIMGGAKVADKIGVIENLLGKVDTLIIGGGMANTFFFAQGYEVGRSLCEKDKVDMAKALLDKAKSTGVKLLLPVDVAIANKLEIGAPMEVVAVDAIPADKSALDIGPASIQLFADALATAKTVVWNGPMGAFEFPPFDQGTMGIARAMVAVQGTTIIGGGDSVAAVEQAGLADQMTHVSTGGGASLEFMEGRVLPGVAALADR